MAAAVRPASEAAPGLVLGLDAASSFTSYRFRDQSRGEIARVANPLLSLSYTVRQFTFGAAAGAPLLLVPGGITSNAAAEHADRTAMGATGGRDAWLWSRNVIPLVLLLGARVPIGDRFELSASMQPGLLVSVNRDASYVALLSSVQGSLRAGADLVPGLAVTMFASGRELDTRDFAQTSVAAFVRWLPAGRFFGKADVTVGLDEPRGLARPTATSWGVTTSWGVRF